MHVFLTGLRGIGKTTIITKIVNGAIADGIISAGGIAGFRTVWTRSGDAEALCIAPYKAESREDLPLRSRRLASPDPLSGVCEPSVSARPVAERDTTNRTLTIHPEVFDEDGVAILRAATEGAARPDLIIMDELGFMESESRGFMKAVTDTLDGAIPVLGVMRWERNPFLDAVEAHETVEVVEVNESNRDALPALLATQIFHG